MGKSNSHSKVVPTAHLCGVWSQQRSAGSTPPVHPRWRGADGFCAGGPAHPVAPPRLRGFCPPPGAPRGCAPLRTGGSRGLAAGRAHGREGRGAGRTRGRAAGCLLSLRRPFQSFLAFHALEVVREGAAVVKRSRGGPQDGGIAHLRPFSGPFGREMWNSGLRPE